jgi:hypothetical protein
MFDGKFRAPVDKAVKPVGAALRKTGLTPTTSRSSACSSASALRWRSAPVSCGSAWCS